MGTRPPKRLKNGDLRRPAVTTMADALFPRTRQRVLALLFGQPERSFGTTELFALAASGRGQVQRELERLVDSGLVSTAVVQRQKSYQANPSSPIFAELTGIIEKIAGVADAIRSALAPLGPRIPLAIMYGSIAKGSDTAKSDIDILVVADGLGLEDLFSALQPAEERLGRKVSPTIYTREEFLRRRRGGNAFLNKILAGKHIVLTGGEDAVATAR